MMSVAQAHSVSIQHFTIFTMGLATPMATTVLIKSVLTIKMSVLAMTFHISLLDTNKI